MHHIPSTGSTNEDMLALARDGAPEGSWLRAGTQSGGRGRQGRQWVSPPGNLYASTLVRRMSGDPPAPSLAMVAAVALDALLQGWLSTDRLVIKWPNDLLADGAKISGILLEGTGDAVVVGIGVNLAHHPDLPDRPATSLAVLGLSAPDPADFAQDLAASFAAWLARWRNEGLGVVLARWQARAHPPGSALRVNAPEGVLEGLYEGLESDGALRLKSADGRVHVVHAGDVFLL
ncbi:biotin--[acetyl-CoA-carboxylase] ligase [Rhizorhabdus dicambivorans]|uniref:biotin--[biotin carboxyl-carrier protein] ligase n=1 Tax=Rhizorhabdus dicambivorans TaxID=1850238 RepID=A0A2A4FX80_9SPHN|nr:biotin--[acetyl-CoA-carboxylase] ligase [Rhizorhabdus dicambivorans]PCE43396.1 biotin--[acetyl-CoA-carboxylase] ligase [Rhizorhabdus dicambivorans]